MVIKIRFKKIIILSKEFHCKTCNNHWGIHTKHELVTKLKKGEKYADYINNVFNNNLSHNEAIILDAIEQSKPAAKSKTTGKAKGTKKGK